MSGDLLQTKLYVPRLRPFLVPRPHLIKKLNQGQQQGCKLSLISAPAGFGKTTLIAEWGMRISESEAILKSEIRNPKLCWLSLDEGDNDYARFLTYFIAALNQVEGASPEPVEGTKTAIGERSLGMLQSPQLPPTEIVLTPLINEITTIPNRIILVLDDYHVIESSQVDGALTFLLENLPPHFHLVIATREDPHLPLPRLRARGHLTELRAIDLRFTSSEAAEFLNQVMGLNLSPEDITALETRTEGWIAGLQLAALALQRAISIQGQEAPTKFIKSFTGSHRLVLDYLIEEVLEQQPESVQTFLLQTAILDRLTGSLCDALTGHDNGQETLEMLEQKNLFIVPLDGERQWYRYLHLFAELLRQRLHQSTASSSGDKSGSVAELHKHASGWYEDNGLEREAFHHATAANDVERATRLMEGDGMPLTFRGVVVPVLDWLESLPTSVLDAKPLLWVTSASALLSFGQTTGVEEKLQAAEAALESVEPDDKTQDLVGRIAAVRATLAWGQNQAETIIAQSHRALEYLHPENIPFRTSTHWKLGFAYQIQGDRAAASQAYIEAITMCQASGNFIINILATTGLGNIQEAENQLYLAAETYRSVLQRFGDHPIPVACEAHLGLACICYEWNDLDAAQYHGQLSAQLARQFQGGIDRFVACEVFLARLKLIQGDVAGAVAILAQVDQSVRQHNFVYRVPEVAAVQILTFLHQGNLAVAADLAQTHELPISQTRVHLAQGDTSAALALLETLRQQAESKDWPDERLKVMVLQAVAQHVHGEKDKAVQLLGDALALAEPGGFIRVFVDEGPPMAQLLNEALNRGIAPDYIRQLLGAFPDSEPEQAVSVKIQTPGSELVEPLSEREIEVLQLIAAGHKYQEVAEQLVISLNTVRHHTKNIYSKLEVNNRTQAIEKANDLDLL